MTFQTLRFRTSDLQIPFRFRPQISDPITSDADSKIQFSQIRDGGAAQMVTCVLISMLGDFGTVGRGFESHRKTYFHDVTETACF